MPRVTLHALAAAPLAIWLYLLLARGRFWRLTQRLPALTAPVAARRIIAIIPARDEADLIGDTVRALLLQRVAGSLEVIVVDDGSSDGTAEMARRAAADLDASARLTVLNGRPLPPGWSGKVWAMAQGVEAAAPRSADYLLFTDADIHHDADAVAALIAQAESIRCDLVSCMVELRAETLAERALVPAFVFFFFMLYPPEWNGEHKARTAGAAGGCMLIRPQALAAAGGLAAIHSELIDDCALARAIKTTGGSVWLGLTRFSRSTRPYGSFTAVGQMISRTAFNQLHHSYALLCGTLAGLALTYVLPPVLLLSGDAICIAAGALAWGLMSLAYLPIVRFYRLRGIWVLALPMVAMFYAGATVHSALRYALRRGGRWKGRIQDA
jgi:hopene-associated glycosyltransferase HpnB